MRKKVSRPANLGRRAARAAVGARRTSCSMVSAREIYALRGQYRLPQTGCVPCSAHVVKKPGHRRVLPMAVLRLIALTILALAGAGIFHWTARVLDSQPIGLMAALLSTIPLILGMRCSLDRCGN